MERPDPVHFDPVHFCPLFSDKEAKQLAKNFVVYPDSALTCKDELQCRIVEFMTKQIVLYLHMVRVECISIREAKI